MRIVVFTGEEGNGGILQMGFTLVRTLEELGHEVYFFLPDIKKIVIPEDIATKSIRYHKRDSLFPKNNTARQIASKIDSLKPEVVLCPEDCIISMQVVGSLRGDCNVFFVIHDVVMHPSKMTFKRRFITKLSSWYRVYGFKYAKQVILLSDNSYQRYCKRYGKYAKKGVICKLGAVPPIEEAKKPPEIDQELEAFYLFFGRIDKYKGINRLLKAYQRACERNKQLAPLLIAGKGMLSEEEKRLVENNHKVLLINRFIENGEMIWLFKNCRVVVLPYIEASQSGVIPLAYHYGKPVIASNIEGIRENVKHLKSGLLFDTEEELAEAFFTFDIVIDKQYEENCLAFSENELNWKKNIGRIVKQG